MSSRPIRVAIVSRSHIVRTGLVGVIGQMDLHAVVTQSEPEQGAAEPCDVAIYDLDVDAIAGPADHAQLQQLLDSGTPVIGLVYGGDRHNLPAPTGTTDRVVSLSIPHDELMELLAQAAEQRAEASATVQPHLPYKLTEREFAIIELIASGMSNDAIANRLYLSINSVKTYIRTAYRKIGVRNRASAVLWDVEHGIGGGQTPPR